jgi:lipid II:glycine glycyltransferase (peptidoglycan interpeptide bridge formation enzyme)
MYPLLAVMKGANRRLLKEAIEELVKVYRHDKETLGDFFAYMVASLERSSTMTRLEKQKT